MPRAGAAWQGAARSRLSWLRLHWLRHCLEAAVATSLLFVVIDLAIRDWSDVSLVSHLPAATFLYVAWGALSGLFIWTVIVIERSLTKAVCGQTARGVLIGSGVYAVLFALACYSTASWAFSGARVSHTWLGLVGPWVFLVAASSGAFGFARLAFFLLVGQRPTGLPIWLVSLGSLALCLIVVDMTILVSLYSRLHTLLEFTAGATLTLACAVWLRWREGHYARWRRWIPPIALGCSVAFGSSERVRSLIDRSLYHVWSEPAYAGRLLRRVTALSALLDDPGSYRGFSMSRLEKLQERYGLVQTSLSPSYRKPKARDAKFQERLAQLRDQKTFNVLVYYVDTLRYDVARQGSIMPNASAFAEQAINFRHVYAAGSDTLRSLPSLTGGRYQVRPARKDDLLRVAERAGYETAVFIAQSAREFLQKLRPSFHFQVTESVPDYAADQEVWGYGADRPTSEQMVTRALKYLAEHRDKKLLTWLFNFDIHNWREIDGAHVDRMAQRYEVPEDGEFNWRYRVIASAVDAQFGRLLDGIEALGLKDKTIVVFVSDHGEGLGEGGFWVHSVFLWESLLRVPLALRIPGVPPRTVDDVVSLVDLVPTLVPYIDPKASTACYHGEDLLGHLLDHRPARRLPIVVVAALRDRLERVGVVDPVEKKKLVVALEAAVLSLHDLELPDGDDHDVLELYPKTAQALLKQVARSPFFPRSPRDFALLELAKSSPDE